MNLIQRLHSHGQPHSHGEHGVHSDGAPFWVRHYDLIVNLITLGRTDAIHRETLSLIDLRPGEAVLDVGCGTGVLLMAAERLVGSKGMLFGLDVESAMVEQARHRASKRGSRACLGVASVAHIPCPAGTFDVIFSTLMYHHLSESQQRAMFDEVKRVLKLGGRFVLVDLNPARRNILTFLPTHSRIEREDYVRREVVEHMQANGLTVVEDGTHPSRQLSFAIGKKV